MRTEINVLGPLEVSIDGVSVVPTASKPQQLLALLAVNAGHVVTNTALVEEIWEHHPPRSALTTLQTYVLHLRRAMATALGDGERSSKDIIVTTRCGYRVNVEPENVDAVRYQKVAAAGRRAVNDGDYLTASNKLGEALEMWRGSALLDVQQGPHLAIKSVQLEETRLSDVDLKIDADLRLGRHHQLLGELAALCARHPMLENFSAQYMLALYRSGRQGRAMQVFQQLRTTVVRQLGVEPSRRLRELHLAMLSGDPMLDDPNYVTSGWVPASVAG